MAKGPLRIAIEDLLTSNPLAEWWKAYAIRCTARLTVAEALIKDSFTQDRALTWLNVGNLWLWEVLYIYTGMGQLFFTLVNGISGRNAPDVSGLLADHIKVAFGKAGTRELVETLGAVVTEPVLALFEQYAGRDDKDPKEFARAFHGLMIGLNVGGGIMDTAIETATAGQVEGAGRMFESVYWSLGLGFLGWQTLAPLLEGGLQPGLRRYYQKLYRPNRFSASELRDLYALGRITREQLYEEARLLGWRDDDIAHWEALAFRNISESDVWALYHAGQFTQANVTQRLLAIGYAASDIPLLFRVNQKPEVADIPIQTISLARQAYREGVLTQQELRQSLTDLKRTPKEADLIIAIENHAIEDKVRQLTTAQLKDAWGSNILSDGEVTYYLTVAGYKPEGIAVLLQSWKAEIAPTFLKVNKGTVIGAYVEGILTRAAAGNKLKGIGLTPEDAALELDLAEARNPDAFGRPAPKPPKTLSLSILTELATAGVLTPDQLGQKVTELGYSAGDAALVVSLARQRLLATPRQLTPENVLGAYLAGVLGRPDALARLVGLGYTKADAELRVTVLERDNPLAFGPDPAPEYKRLTPNLIISLLAVRLLDRAGATLRLRELGYTDADASLIISLGEQAGDTLPRPLSVAAIERAYVAGVLDVSQVRSKLLELDYTRESAESLILTWQQENPAVFAPETVTAVRQPSVTALITALQNGIITELEYYGRMFEAGYSRQAADIYRNTAKSNERKGTRTLSVAQIQDAYEKDFFTRGQALERVTSLGYGNEDAALLLRFVKSGIEDTEVWSQVTSGLIDVEVGIQQLVNGGYTIEEVAAAFKAWKASLANEQTLSAAI